MKRFITLAAILLASVLLFSGCEKHAYTTTTNIVRASRGGAFTTVHNSYTMKLGTNAYFIVTEKNKNTYSGGEYSANVNPVEGSDFVCVTATPGTFKDEKCLVLSAIQKGESEVSLNFYVNGFHFYRTITVTVQ